MQKDKNLHKPLHLYPQHIPKEEDFKITEEHIKKANEWKEFGMDELDSVLSDIERQRETQEIFDSNGKFSFALKTWEREFPRQLNSNFEQLWQELEQQFYIIYNDPIKVGMETYKELYKNIYAMTHIKYVLRGHKEGEIGIIDKDYQDIYYIKYVKSNDQLIKEDVKHKFYERITFFLVEFTNALRALEMETDHLDLLKKYSKLWKMFLRGTLIIDGICSSWKNSWLPEQFNGLRQFGKDRWLSLEDKENESIEFLDPYTFALKAWKNVFFQTLNNRLTDAISYLVEHERTGDRLINTKLLTDELFQSFKILDAKRINDKWAIQLRASRLKTTSYLDRNKRPKITMYDKYEFFNWFNTFVYPQIKRPRSIENITKEKLTEILDDDDNEYNIISEFLILPKENLDEVVNRNPAYCKAWRQREREKLKKNKQELIKLTAKNFALKSELEDLENQIMNLKDQATKLQSYEKMIYSERS